MFLDETHMQKVIFEKKKWDRLVTEISSLSTSNTLGEEMFSRFCPDIIESHLTSFFKARVLAYQNTAPAMFTKDNKNTELGEMFVEAQRVQADKIVTWDRAVKVSFADGVVEVPVSCSIEEARFHLDGMLKTMALKSGDVKQLAIEKEVHPIKVVPGCAKFEPGMLEDIKANRASMDKEIQGFSYATAEQLYKQLYSKKQVWARKDASFILDCHRIKNFGGPIGSSLLLDQFIAALPDGTKHNPEYEDVLASFQALQDSKAWLFAGETTHNRCKALIRVISGMKRHEGPFKSLFADGTPLAPALEGVGNFLTALEDGSLKTGLDALEIHMNGIRALIDSKKISDLSLVTNCETFSFLLAPEDKADLARLRTQAWDLIVAKGAGDASGAAGKPSAGVVLDAMVVAAAGKAAAAAKKGQKRAAAPPKKGKALPVAAKKAKR